MTTQLNYSLGIYLWVILIQEQGYLIIQRLNRQIYFCTSQIVNNVMSKWCSVTPIYSQTCQYIHRVPIIFLFTKCILHENRIFSNRILKYNVVYARFVSYNSRDFLASKIFDMIHNHLTSQILAHLG